jgi:hypothetical protein
MHPGKTAVAWLTVLSTKVSFGFLGRRSSGVMDGFDVI